MAEQPDAQTPEDRAEAAARDLADRGQAVTARAVREAAGVRMAVAAAAARAWREATAEASEVEVPEVPVDVTARLAAVWADAYRAAVAAVTPERDQLASEVEELRGEVEALTATVSEVEDEQATIAGQRDAAQQAQQACEEQLREVTQTLSSRDATIVELREHNSSLTAQVTELIARIPSDGAGAEPEADKR